MRVLRAQELNMKCPVKTPSSRTLMTSVPPATKMNCKIEAERTKPKAAVSLFKERTPQNLKVIPSAASSSTSTALLSRNVQTSSSTSKLGNIKPHAVETSKVTNRTATGFSLPEINEEDDEEEEDDEIEDSEDYESELMLTVDGRNVIDNDDVDLLDEESDDLSP